MGGANRFAPNDVIPACLLPFHADMRIDEVVFRKHLNDVVALAGHTCESSYSNRRIEISDLSCWFQA